MPRAENQRRAGDLESHVPVDDDAVVILEVFQRKTGKTPEHVLEICKARAAEYDRVSRGD